MLNADLPRIEKDLREELQHTRSIESRVPASALPDLARAPDIRRAIMEGAEKYSDIRCLVLAIFALPGASAAETHEHEREATTAQAHALQAGISRSRVVLLANASHYIFLSNEADVLREINSFIPSLH